MNLRVRVGVVAALAVIIGSSITACTPQSVPTTHPTPTRTPSREGPPLSGLVLSANGLTGALLGKPVPKGTRLARFDPIRCVSAANGIKPGDADAGAWAVNYPDIPDDPSGHAPSDVEPFDLIVYPQSPSGDLAVVWVWSTAIRTAEGIHVGSSVAAVEAAYPDPTAVEHGPNSDVYRIDGPVGKLYIEIAHTPAASGGLGADYWGEQNDTVLWMSAADLKTDYGPVAVTDNIPAPCLDSDDE